MAASRDLPFPLVIVCLVLIRGYFSLPTTSRVAGTNPTGSLAPRGFSTKAVTLAADDYSQYEDPVTPAVNTKVLSNAGPHERCNYDPCRESQVPCPDLAARTGCLCPGFTLYNEVPEAPRLKSVAWNGSEVVIRWCAPNSYVTSYTVTVGGEEAQTFEKNRRSAGVGDIDHIAKVCVAAVNGAGEGEKDCQMYHPSDSSLPLKAGLIGGALGLLLLLLLGVLLWRHKRQRKQEASISMHNTAGTQ
ncbi:hypothetical protein ABVT39_018015 [Epinephelus coioides]